MLVGILQGICIVILFTVVTYIYDKNNSSKLYLVLFYLTIGLIIESVGMFMQLLFADLVDIPPVYYEYFASMGSMITPTLFLMFAFLYNNYNTKLNKFYYVFAFEIILMISLWTNDFHHLFFETYSMDGSLMVPGFLYYIFRFLYYFQLFYGIYILIKASFRKSGFLSFQTLLIIVAYLLPAIPIFASWGGLIYVPRYIIPIPYMGSILCIMLAIVKLKALNVIPIAQDTIVETMTDAFFIMGLDGTMTDMNKIFEDRFVHIMDLKKNSNIYDIIKNTEIEELKKIKEIIDRAHETKESVIDEIHILTKTQELYFQIEVCPIKEKKGKEYIAYLVTLRDITIQKKEVEILIKNENLAIVGELAGGIAHDINTPITAIRSGLLMLKEKKFTKDEKNMLESMSHSADKISTLVNSLRNQMRNLGTSEDVVIDLNELMQDLQVIMYSEFAKNKIRMNIFCEEEIKIKGSNAKITQVLNNIFSNSIKAYKDQGGIIEVRIYKSQNKAIIEIEDWAGGISDKIKPYIFKNVISSSYSPSIGVGLYLAYSIIKGSFNGEITFETKENIGTKFLITIPIVN